MKYILIYNVEDKAVYILVHKLILCMPSITWAKSIISIGV